MNAATTPPFHSYTRPSISPRTSRQHHKATPRALMRLPRYKASVVPFVSVSLDFVPFRSFLTAVSSVKIAVSCFWGSVCQSFGYHSRESVNQNWLFGNQFWAPIWCLAAYARVGFGSRPVPKVNRQEQICSCSQGVFT